MGRAEEDDVRAGTGRRRTAVVALAAAAALVTGGAVTATPSQAAPAAGTGTPVTVMTRNLYLGGDITRPLDATGGLSGLPALLAFGQSNHVLAGIVDQTDFPARATALAREIATQDPDVVGLQEVALWRHGDLQLGQIGVPNAETVDYDFLQTLLDELAALGVDYRVAEVQEESDVEGPAFATQPADGTGRDVRLTMRDAILVKARPQGRGQRQRAVPDPHHLLDRRRAVLVHPRLELRRHQEGHEAAARGQHPPRVAELRHRGPAGRRAAGRAGARHGASGGRRLRLQLRPAERHRQAAGPDAALDRLPPADRQRAVDEWTQWSTTDPGFTSGFGELVDDADASAIDHRIDLVLAHGADGKPLRVDRGVVVGTDPAEKVGGLWPSDHAGVVLRLRP